MASRYLARAKVNLCLHVTGRRDDGYHLLDSLVVFADLGDQITCQAADHLSLTITGPQAAQLPVSDDNLVLRAARLLGAGGAAITLDKVLPVASGIGGGSADAAAALRALSDLWQLPLPDAATVLRLGADVPVCLAGHAARMQGVGDLVTPVAPMPAVWLVLVNPGVAVSTPAVFKALVRRDNPPLPPLMPWADTAAFADWLALTRNDLEAPALMLAPVIGAVKAALAAQTGCLLVRMSGSGATCFGLFADPRSAAGAAAALRQSHSDWWIADAALCR